MKSAQAIRSTAGQAIRVIFLTVFACMGHSLPLHAQGGCTNPYIVQNGDSLSKIAQRCGVAVAALQTANPQIVNISKINVGDKITIPGVMAKPDGAMIGNNSLFALSNATYQVEGIGEIVLIDGVAHVPFDTSTRYDFGIAGPIGEGDINQDGAPDAVVMLLRTGNFNGRYYSLHVMLGQPNRTFRNVASVSVDYPAIELNAIQVASGQIQLTMLTSAENDSVVSAATLAKMATYRLTNNSLQLVNVVNTPTAGQTNTGQTNASQTNTTCTLASQLFVGAQAVVTPGDPNGLYMTAGGKAVLDSNQRNVQIPAGSVVQVTGESRCIDGILFWPVTFGAYQGWTGEGKGKAIWLMPATTPTAGCPDGLPTRLQIGGRARVTPGASNTLWSHWESASKPQALEKMTAGSTLQILAGPQCRDGYTWWQVRSETSQQTGWTAESQSGEGYFLALE